ncbi:alpha/beta hydrolase [Alicyclobacillus dauci]|uniref:Esterase family protein n=1 Tax=Alicyclobacillus dauci TaxID=1475485 RepID=A0ABY6Z1J5_9BACL|nr:alpha/beta hydrolase family protein [Alicyclobacillus dauci]WAH36754.1 esterase family protein [Alicyclobacillus dauci]
MALVTCRFFSEVLGLSTTMTVLLPERRGANQNPNFDPPSQTLYLLHGRTDDDSAWTRYTSIERYVWSLPLVVIMPQVHLSYYHDMAYGNRYWTFVSEELPEVAQSFFHLSQERDDTFVAGLSMGGYGAMRLALRQPDRFAAAASLSGALDVASAGARRRLREYSLMFGSQDISGTEADLIHLLATFQHSTSTRPRLYQWCGTEDFLYEENQVFRRACEQSAFDLTYRESPGGHEWAHWDAQIQEVLNWLPIRGRTSIE